MDRIRGSISQILFAFPVYTFVHMVLGGVFGWTSEFYCLDLMVVHGCVCGFRFGQVYMIARCDVHFDSFVRVK